VIRFLALDIDGTLLNSRWELPPENVDAVARSVSAGVEVALVTGRRFDFARPIMDALGVPLTMIVSNGAVVKDHLGVTLSRRILGRQTAAQVLELTAAWRSCAALLFDRTHDAQIVFERIDLADDKRRRFYEINREAIAERPLRECLDEDPVQIMFSGELVPMRALREFLTAQSPSANGGVSRSSAGPRDNADCAPSAGSPPYSVSITEYEHRDFALVDVMAEGCSKGSAVAAWAASRGYARSEVMAIGDNLNDLEMLEFAGLPIVMGNAAGALRSQANGWRFTATNDEGGVAAAIREYILGI
jgi:hydroxymethylpyrimidine pyrophosphatase-like HAD family hydrolase